jgi:hypothetical protein
MTINNQLLLLVLLPSVLTVVPPLMPLTLIPLRCQKLSARRQHNLPQPSLPSLLPFLLLQTTAVAVAAPNATAPAAAVTGKKKGKKRGSKKNNAADESGDGEEVAAKKTKGCNFDDEEVSILYQPTRGCE